MLPGQRYEREKAAVRLPLSMLYPSSETDRFIAVFILFGSLKKRRGVPAAFICNFRERR